VTQRQHPGLRAVSGGLDALTHLGNTCHRGPRGRPDRDVHQDARFLIDVPTTAAEMEAVGEAAVVVLVDKVSIGVLGLEDQLRAGGRGTVAELIALTGTAPVLLTQRKPPRSRRRSVSMTCALDCCPRTRSPRCGTSKTPVAGCCWSGTASTTPPHSPRLTPELRWAAPAPISPSRRLSGDRPR